MQKSLQAADDAHFVTGALDADRYARTVQRLQGEIENRRALIIAAEIRQRTENDRDAKRQRLLDVLANGATVLLAADPTAANIWLRTHLRVWLKDKEPLIVEWL